MEVKLNGKGRALVYATSDDVYYRRTPIADVFQYVGRYGKGWQYALTGESNKGGVCSTRALAANAAAAEYEASFAPSEAYYVASDGKDHVVSYGNTPGLAFINAEKRLDDKYSGILNVNSTMLRTRPAHRLDCGCLPWGSGCYGCRYEYYMST